GLAAGERLDVRSAVVERVGVGAVGVDDDRAVGAVERASDRAATHLSDSHRPAANAICFVEVGEGPVRHVLQHVAGGRGVVVFLDPVVVDTRSGGVVGAEHVVCLGGAGGPAMAVLFPYATLFGSGLAAGERLDVRSAVVERVGVGAVGVDDDRAVGAVERA